MNELVSNFFNNGVEGYLDRIKSEVEENAVREKEREKGKEEK